MHRFLKRVSSVMVAGALVLSGLAACGANEPKNAEEIITRYATSANNDNYHSDITMNYKMSLLGQSLDLSMKMNMDTAGNNSHMTAESSGLGNLGNTEMYLVKNEKNYTQYACYNPKDANSTWTKTEVNEPSFMNPMTFQDVLKRGELSKTGEGYQITVSGKEVLSSLSSSGTNVVDTMKTLAGGNENISEMIDNSKAVFTFDKDCYLTGFTYNLDVIGGSSTNSSSSSSDSSTVDLSTGITLGIDMKVSNYGKVDASTVTVPESVKDSATDSAASDLNLDALVSPTDGNAAANSSSAS